MLECLIRVGETKHVREKWESPAEGRIQLLDTLAKLLLDLERVVILLDLEVDAEHPQDRQIRRRLAVGHAVAFEPRHVLALQGFTQFVQQARLPHTRLPYDTHHLTATRSDAREALVQNRQVLLTSHQLGQAPIDAHFQTGSPATAAHHAIDAYGLTPPFDRHRSQSLGSDVSLDKSVGGLGNQDRPRLGHTLHARREVGRVPHGGVVHSQVVADPAHDDETGVEAKAEVKLHTPVTLELLTVAAERFLDRQSRLDAPKGVI